MAPFQDGAGGSPVPKGSRLFVYEPDSPGCRASRTDPKAPSKASPDTAGSAEAPKKKDAEAPRKAEAPTKKTAEARKQDEARKQAEALKKELAARAARARANGRPQSEQLTSKVTRPVDVAEESAFVCKVEPASGGLPASGKVVKVVTLVRDRSGREIAPDAPAPAPGTKNPELPPPPGKDYAAKKAAGDARHAPVEVDRLLGELGRKFGTALGEAEASLNSLNTNYTLSTPLFDQLRRDSKKDPGRRARMNDQDDAFQAGLAAKLNAIPELPTYADPTLAAIAQKAFERGFGAGVAEAKARGTAVDLAFTVALSLGPSAAVALERAGAVALSGALARLRSMPLFVPTTVGGGGVFLRVAKSVCRALTAADLGLAEGANVVGTFSVRGGKATAYIKYLGEPAEGLGTGLLGARESLKRVARDAGATTLRIEASPIIEKTGTLLKGLLRKGFLTRPNGTMWWEGSL